MKVIFLDVDGVLNCYLHKFTPALEDAKIKLLKEIVDVTDAKIVLSSSWRENSNLKYKLVTKLAEYNLEIYDHTPILWSGTPRSREIERYIQSHYSEIEQFVILDDGDFDEARLKAVFPHHFIKTNIKYGLTSTKKDRAIKVLTEGVEWEPQILLKDAYSHMVVIVGTMSEINKLVYEAADKYNYGLTREWTQDNKHFIDIGPRVLYYEEVPIKKVK